MAWNEPGEGPHGIGGEETESGRDPRGVRGRRGRPGAPGRGAGSAGETVPSTVQVQTYLGGVEYPATREALLERARANDAPEEVIRALERMADAEYPLAVDVTREIGRVAPEQWRATPGPSPAHVLSYLKGVRFPATRAALIEMAERQSAPETVLAALRKICDGVYLRVVDISKEIGKQR